MWSLLSKNKPFKNPYFTRKSFTVKGIEYSNYSDKIKNLQSDLTKNQQQRLLVSNIYKPSNDLVKLLRLKVILDLDLHLDYFLIDHPRQKW